MIISTDVLKSALICASDELARPHISGVYIDQDGFVVSTDGHRMFVAQIDLMGDAGGYIIPADTLKRVLHGNKKPAIEVTAASIDGLTYTPAAATFPAWRNVIPADVSGVAAQFNPDYIADFGKIGALLGCGKKGTLRAHIHHNGEAPAGISFMGREDCFGVLMPMRSAHTNAAQGWIERARIVSPAQMAA